MRNRLESSGEADVDARAPSRSRAASIRRSLSAFGCIVVLLLLGSLYSTNFLSPDYLLQQLQVASFLGLIATGMMLVILLGHIDLSVPWVVTAGGMMSTAAAGWGGPWEHARDPVRHRLRRAVRRWSTASASPTCASRR